MGYKCWPIFTKTEEKTNNKVLYTYLHASFQRRWWKNKFANIWPCHSCSLSLSLGRSILGEEQKTCKIWITFPCVQHVCSLKTEYKEETFYILGICFIVLHERVWGCAGVCFCFEWPISYWHVNPKCNRTEIASHSNSFLHYSHFYNPWSEWTKVWEQWLQLGDPLTTEWKDIFQKDSIDTKTEISIWQNALPWGSQIK